ncbi:MAG: hypothetical protein IKE53_05835, partial [Clostridiales bacterium]|nr:hypothetical protein [Clostridiales bacterium]
MTIHAYQETYLNKAQISLGDAFDYAVNTCSIPGNDFVRLFTSSSVSKRIENGDPAVIAGRSGIEIAIDAVLESTGRLLDIEPREHFERSREYWIGWSTCYYQWYSSRSFGDIFSVLPFDDLQIMYYTLHEADISLFVCSVKNPQSPVDWISYRRENVEEYLKDDLCGFGFTI